MLRLIAYSQHQFDDLIQSINAKGYGLTMGLHSRIDQRIQQLIAQAKVGNLYINRNMVGAVVGVQPFGSEGLSGTGPKAGGPLYLQRLMQSRAQPYLTYDLADYSTASIAPPAAYLALLQWCQQYAPSMQFSLAHLALGQTLTLQGPTGEQNLYRLVPHARILSITNQLDAYLQQWAAILSLGSQVVLCSDSAVAMSLFQQLPATVQQHFIWVDQLQQADVESVLYQGTTEECIALQVEIAKRIGKIISVHHVSHAPIAVERLLLERLVSINSTAAGGNASLMSVDLST